MNHGVGRQPRVLRRKGELHGLEIEVHICADRVFCRVRHGDLLPGPAPEASRGTARGKGLFGPALTSDKIVTSVNSGIHKCVDLGKEAAMRTAQRIREKVEEAQLAVRETRVTTFTSPRGCRGLWHTSAESATRNQAGENRPRASDNPRPFLFPGGPPSTCAWADRKPSDSRCRCSC